MATDRRHNNGPAISEADVKAHIDNPPPYFFFWWDRFWGSCARAGMKPDEVGGFLAALTMQWSMAGRFHEDEIRRMHFLTGWDVRTCKSLLRKLIDKRKMEITVDGYIVSHRMNDEITKYCKRKQSERNTAASQIISEITPEIGPDIRTDLSPDLRADLGVDLSKKHNENNKTDVENTPPHARRLKDSKNKNTPHTPHGGDARAESDVPEVKKSKRELTKAEIALTERAREIWNGAADHFGFLPWQGGAGDKTRLRLSRRLDAIGDGDPDLAIQRFRKALWSLRHQSPLTDWLLGRVKARDGGAAFRLDLSRFLQTDGNMGDVISRLLDLDAAAGADKKTAPASMTTDELRDHLANLSDAEQQKLVADNANGIWPMAKLAYPPGHMRCAIRPQNYQAVGITDQTYDRDGLRRGKC